MIAKEKTVVSAAHTREPTAWRFSKRSTAVRLFLTCWIVYALHFATNIVREIYPALSLGDNLSFDVSEYLGMHPDIFEIPGRGTFINNNPGASIVGAVPYLLARPLIDRVSSRVQQKRQADAAADAPDYESPWPMAREFHRRAHARGLDVKFGLAAGVMQAFAMAPISALSVVVMFMILTHLASSVRAGVLLALLYAFATPVFFRTAQLNQNLLVSHCGLFAFAMIWRPWDPPNAPRLPRYFWAGLLCGWAVVCDYSGLVIVLVLSGYAFFHRASLPESAKTARDLWRLLGGIGLSGCVLVAYQWSCFGDPFLPAQHFMPPAHYTDTGYVGLDWPRLDLLWATAFDLRFGLFTSAPLLLLALYVPGWLRRRGCLLNGRELRCVLAIAVAFFLFCSANQYGRMQFNTGVRHVVPVTPFLFLLVAGVLLRMPTILSACVAIAGTYWSWCLAMYRDVERGLGVVESIAHITLGGLQLPWMTTLQRMPGQFADYFPHGASAVPVLLVSGGIIAVLWTVRDGRRLRAVC